MPLIQRTIKFNKPGRAFDGLVGIMSSTLDILVEELLLKTIAVIKETGMIHNARSNLIAVAICKASAPSAALF